MLARLSSPQRLQGENPSLPSPAFRGSPQSLTWSYINIVFDAVFTCVSIVRTLIGFRAHLYDPRGFRGSSSGQELRDMGSIPGLEDPLEEGMATHSSILAWRTPWTEEPGRLQSTGLKKSRTQLMWLSTHTHMIQDNLISRSLIISAKTLSPNPRLSQGLGVRLWIYLLGRLPFSPPYYPRKKTANIH